MQANWEPRYSRSCHRIPWQQYATVEASLRHFSYNVVALHGCLQSEIQMVEKLGHVMDKVEELGKMSQFREIRDDDDEIVVTFERPQINTAKNDMSSYGGAE
ncbi:hypothetical protein KIW84_063147 [Lathyrus oleraceus]|uniref:Uncharacterized protein n=1 Tax=Pisum sativum TaxID=3888 RepID=A0A9D4W7S5_PEA|nr:hypothetical protein KIW84_063147 [Pisum sativum]